MDPPVSPTPSLPDEGYDEQRIEIPKWVQQWSDEQRAVHLLSFLDASTLVNVALVSKAWNKFASDNSVWKGIYFRNGWNVNQEMVDWYLSGSELEDRVMHERLGSPSRVHFESGESSVSRGKRKMIECDAREVEGSGHDGDDYDMLQTHIDRDEDDDSLYFHRHARQLNYSADAALPSYSHPEDVIMAQSPDDEQDKEDGTGGSAIARFLSSPSSSQLSDETGNSALAKFLSSSPGSQQTVPLTPVLPSIFESGMSPSRHRGSFSSPRTPPGSQRHGRFSLSNAPFITSLHRPRLPTYSLSSNLMTPPSMLKRMAQRNSPPSPLRLPNVQATGSSSSWASRSPRLFGHQRSSSLDQSRSGSQPSSPTSPTYPCGPNHSQGLPHSPLTTKSLWSVIRHGVMGVSGSGAWPSLNSNRQSDTQDPDGSSAHHTHHFSPSLPAWLMHLPSPLTTASSRHHRTSASSAPTSPASANFSSMLPNNSDMATDSTMLKLPRRIQFSGPNTPLPSQALTPEILGVHRDPATNRAAINWKHLCKQRKRLEKNWNKGIHQAKDLPGHTEGIYCIQFDEHKIVSGSRDNTIKIWDLTTGRCLRTYTGHSASVLCLQYDEERIVSGSSDTTIIVWDLDTGAILQRLRGHADSVLSLRFEKDTVVSCSKDRTVKIWKISTGEMLRTLSGHRAAVNAVQFSPENSVSPFAGSPRIVVSASGDRSIKIWSFETGECLRTLEGHARGIACIQFESNIIVSGSSDRSIKIWDLARGECIKTLVGHEDLVRTLQFSGGRIISGGYDETLKIWDQESGRLLADLEGGHHHRVFKLQFNESKIVSCSQDQK
ncbi:hypothetical protein BGW38_004205, partial [Lunasporangiospora selenospora]